MNTFRFDYLLLLIATIMLTGCYSQTAAFLAGATTSVVVIKKLRDHRGH